MFLHKETNLLFRAASSMDLSLSGEVISRLNMNGGSGDKTDFAPVFALVHFNKDCQTMVKAADCFLPSDSDLLCHFLRHTLFPF